METTHRHPGRRPAPACAPAHGSEGTSCRGGPWLDRIGRSGSGACMVHCLATSLVAGTAGLGRLLGALEVWFHPLAAIVLVPVTLLAMQRGEERTRTLLGSGALLLILAVGAQLAGSEIGSTLLTALGSVGLLLGHRRRVRLGAG